MIYKTKEFIVRGNYYNDINIDDKINKFLEENANIKVINIKYTNSSLGDSSEFYVRALLIYKEPEVNPLLNEYEYNDLFGIGGE